MLALVVLTACRDSSAGEARTTVPTRPPTSSTTATTAVSYDVPAVIDAVYVEKVMAALDHVEGEAVRRAAAQGRLDETFVRTLASIYGPEAAELTQQVWSAVAGNGFKMLARYPKDPRTKVLRMIVSERSCILAEIERDFSQVFTKPDPPSPRRFLALTPLPVDRNPGGQNPTPWTISFDGHFTDESEPGRGDAC